MGKKNGRIVSTGSILCLEDGAYVYNVATLEGERRKGYASNVTYALLQIARQHGIEKVALVSSPMAVSLFKKLGYQEKTKIHIYA